MTLEELEGLEKICERANKVLSALTERLDSLEKRLEISTSGECICCTKGV